MNFHKALSEKQKENIQLFFGFLFEKNFKASKETLKQIESLFPKNDRFKGLFMSLSGMLDASIHKGKHTAFINDMDFTDIEKLESLKDMFMKESKKKTHTPYDKGFFTGWYLFVDFLINKPTTEVVV